MKLASIVSGVIGLLVGVILTGIYTSAQSGTASQTMDMSMDHGMTMDEMVDSLKGKSGDEFDKAFLSEMIDHHQGAVDMAAEAKVNAKHDELKTMADEIITSQSKEIDQMTQWQMNWGYTQN